MSIEYLRFRARIDSKKSDKIFLNDELNCIRDLVKDYEKLATLYSEVYPYRDVFQQSFDCARRLFVLHSMQEYIHLILTEHAIAKLEASLHIFPGNSKDDDDVCHETEQCKNSCCSHE